MKSLCVNISGAAMNSADIRRQVRLEPGSRYEFQMAAYYPGYGLDIRVILTETESGREIFSHDIGWFAFLPRTEFSFEFQTSSVAEYHLEIHAVHEDSQSVCEIESVTFSSLENIPPQQRCVYTHSIMRDFDPLAPVPGKWLTDSLEFRGGVNQTTARLCGFQADRDFAGVGVRLEAPRGIAAACFELRDIKKQVLPPTVPRRVRRGERLGWWLTFTPPADLVPGNHNGKLIIYDGDSVLAELPLLLNIADYRLPEADIAFLQYHSERYIPGEYLSDTLRRKYYEDMRRHGMNTVTVYNNPDVDGKCLDLEHNWQFSGEEHRLRIERGCKGMERENTDSWNRKFNFGLIRELEMISAAGLARELPILWLAGKIAYSQDHNDWWGGMEPEQLKAIYRQWSPDWPQPLYYVIDEPSGYSDRTEKALELLKNIKDADCDIPTVSANIDEFPLGKYYNVWIQAISRIDEGMCRAAAGNNAALWAYCCSANNQCTILPRVMFGFWPARTGVRGVAQWAYYDARDQFCGDADHSRCRLSRVGLSAAGPIPTVGWEATREGTIDYRIVLLFRQALATLHEIPGEESAQLLREGEKTLGAALNSVSFNLFAPMNGSGSFAERNSFKPVIGLGDPETIFERKRQSLLKYIAKVNQFIKGKENENHDLDNDAAQHDNRRKRGKKRQLRTVG